MKTFTKICIWVMAIPLLLAFVISGIAIVGGSVYLIEAWFIFIVSIVLLVGLLGGLDE